MRFAYDFKNRLGAGKAWARESTSWGFGSRLG